MFAKMYKCLLVTLVGLLAIGSGQSKFTAYWNVPLDKCNKLGIHINLTQYDIVHNEDGNFYGDKVNIFYDAGMFPVIGPANNTINGGIPPRGNLSLHTDTFLDRLNQLLTHNYSGPAPLDFETYLPSYDINLPSVYKVAMIDWVRQIHPEWNSTMTVNEARKTFDTDIKPYFQSLLALGSEARPKAMFGYYHYPYCLNHDPPYTSCNPNMMKLNDEMQPWLYNVTTALYPSVYTFYTNVTSTIRWNKITTKLRETQRINFNNDLPVLPYFWYRYHDVNRLLEPSVATAVLWMVRQFGGQGVMVWGSSADLIDQMTCTTFKNYMEETLGPLLKCFHDMPDGVVKALMDRYPTEEGMLGIQDRSEDDQIEFMIELLDQHQRHHQQEDGDRSYDDQSIIDIDQQPLSVTPLPPTLVNNTEYSKDDISRQKFILRRNRKMIVNLLKPYCKAVAGA